MEYDYIKLDNAVGEIIVYLHDMCIEQGEIVLLDFNWHNLSHRTIFQAATIASKLYNLKLYVKCSLIDYIRLQYKYRKRAVFHWYNSQINGIFCDPLVTRIEQKVNKVGVLKEVYEAYYND